MTDLSTAASGFSAALPFLLAGLLLIGASGWPLWRAWRRPPPAEGNALDALDLLRGQRRALAAQRSAGALDDADHARALAEIAQRALAEAVPRAPVMARPGGSLPGAAGLALAVVVALGAYLVHGRPDLAVPRTDSAVARDDVADMVDRMARSLAAQPAGRAEDAVAWAMLARAQAGLQRWADAERSLGEALERQPDQPDWLADRADLLGLLPGADRAAQAERLIARALAVAPQHPKALALAGAAAHARQDLPAAQRLWTEALRHAPPGSPLAQGLASSLAALGAPPVAAGSAVASSQGPALRGSVEIAPALAADLRPADVLYVVARREQGGGPPLAVWRQPARAAASAFLLGPEQAMVAGEGLAGHERVVIEARVSRGGQALPQAGDWVSEARAVAVPAQGLRLRIDRVRP